MAFKENEEMDEEEAEIEASKSSHKDHLFQFKNFESVSVELSAQTRWR